MKFKLDENLGPRIQRLFQAHGHDAQSVPDEKLQGCPDEQLYEVCRSEGRCLITLDLDFADVTRFPPSGLLGIAVIRTPGTTSTALLERLAIQLLDALSRDYIENRLWIVEAGRVRIHDAPKDS